MLGNADTAEASLLEAYEIFDPVDYHYQAMLCASALAEVTGDEKWHACAKRHLAHYPSSPLMNEATEQIAKTNPTLEQLTPFQQRIARALWGGAERQELSERFSRSSLTIDRHLAEIYAAFDVRNVNELRKKATTLGLA